MRLIISSKEETFFSFKRYATSAFKLLICSFLSSFPPFFFPMLDDLLIPCFNPVTLRPISHTTIIFVGHQYK